MVRFRSVKSFIRRQIQRIARVFAEEFRAVLEDHDAKKPARVQIDVVDAISQMGSSAGRDQLNHFYMWNHRWIAMLSERNRRTAVETWDFIDEMASPLFVIRQFDVIKAKREEMLLTDGQILDLGVYKGASTRALAEIFPEHTIHGFDSFEGLPDDWSHVTEGHFGDVRGQLPAVPGNVELHKGWFEDTLGPWVEAHPAPQIMLMRVDCDIYSSTKTILRELAPLIGPGTWIVFDELIGYRGWQDHEHKAFEEFLAETGHGVDWIAHGLTYVMVRLTEAPTAASGTPG